MSLLEPTEEYQIQKVAEFMGRDPHELVRAMIDDAYTEQTFSRQVFQETLGWWIAIVTFTHVLIKSVQSKDWEFGEPSFWEKKIENHLASPPQTITKEDMAAAHAVYRRIYEAITNPAREHPNVSAQIVRPFYETATPEEWSKAFSDWAESHRSLPPLPPQTYDRAYFYEDLD